MVNSGESILIFDLSITLSHGVSGLIKMLSLNQDIIPALTEDRIAPYSDTASQHPLFLQSLISTQTSEHQNSGEGAQTFSASNYVHIKDFCLCGASYSEIVADDSTVLIRQRASFALTNGQAWTKGAYLNH